MKRAPFQVLVIPFKLCDTGVQFAIFRRFDSDSWQFISGGGDDGERPLEAAKREANEEAGIHCDAVFTSLDSVASIPVDFIGDRLWGDENLMIPEHCFSVHVEHSITLSSEHSEFEWCSYEKAIKTLSWESNRNALWEVNEKLKINQIQL